MMILFNGFLHIPDSITLQMDFKLILCAADATLLGGSVPSSKLLLILFEFWKLEFFFDSDEIEKKVRMNFLAR